MVLFSIHTHIHTFSRRLPTAAHMTRIIVLLFTCMVLERTDAFAPLTPRACQPRSAVAMTAAADLSKPSLFELIADRDFGSLVQRAREEPTSLLELVKDAGISGAISYTVVELSFFAIALPTGFFTWHATTGEWLQPLLLLQEDGVEGKARLLGLLLSYIVLLKSFFPVRLGSTVLLTPYIKRLLDSLPALPLPPSSTFTAGAQRRSLKAELLELARASRGGIEPFDAAAQARFERVMAQLPALNPTADPARSTLFNGEWTCVWTTEKELNFAVDKGLFGLPWVRTYQTIDVPGGTLSNVIEFDGGALTVGSTIAPDTALGSRFNFAFERCTVRWRGLTVPLPPVGKGWGELLYLDDELRIQKDVRGDFVIATKVR